MAGGRKPRFDLDALRRLAGDKAFARGEDYHRAGRVEILAIEPGRVLARVSGSEDYRSVLTGGGGKIGGECSCPAFEDWGFCKHLVAAALSANDVGGADAGVSALERIRRHLQGKGIDALVGMIVDLAERDAALFRRLEMDAATASDDDETLFDRFRKAIAEATRTDGYVPYREVAGWADGVGAVLDRVAALVAEGRAEAALRLIDHAIARIEKSMEEIDDSDGHCGGLLERARDIHLSACRAARPDPAALARELYAREVEGEWDTFDGSAARYADVLGDEGLAEFRRLAAADWEKMPPLAGGRQETDHFSPGRDRLAAILDFFAERDGDVERRIAIRAKDLSSPWRYLEVARFCLSQGRVDEALRRAEEGLWLFEDDPPDERLVAFAADLNVRAGRGAEAEAVLWRAFERNPSLHLYRRLRQLAGEAARDRALSFLKSRLAVAERGGRWHSPADLLIQVLTVESMFAEAWEAVRMHGAADGLRNSLAEASEATHPREAMAVYVARVDRLVSTGGNANYQEACRLVARMGALRGASEQAAYVAGLKARFKAKRNFMKLLGT
jgi:tetratricopeptide (TPR) repeat protein